MHRRRTEIKIDVRAADAENRDPPFFMPSEFILQGLTLKSGLLIHE